MESFSVSYQPNPAELSAVAAGLTRFERMRVIPGLVIVGAGTAFVYSTGNTTLSIVPFAVFIAFAGLCVRWLTTAARVGRAARAQQGPTTVNVSSDGLELARGGAVVAKTAWTEVAVCTNTDNCWIFVPRKSKEIIFLPRKDMAAAQQQQVGAILAGWSKRRYRTTPW